MVQREQATQAMLVPIMLKRVIDAPDFNKQLIQCISRTRDKCWDHMTSLANNCHQLIGI
jgi:hypothetical protein